MQSKIFDCITFFDNNFMFNLRYNILKDYIDHFPHTQNFLTWFINAFGGVTAESGFNIANSNHTVLAFSLTNDIIPAGSGILLTITIEYMAPVLVGVGTAPRNFCMR